MEYREAAYEELYDAAKANLNFQGQREARLATQQRFEMGQQAAADREFRAIANRLGSEIRTKFTQVEEGKIGLRNARLALDQIKADLAEGRKASSIQFNVAARGLAKAFNSGAMSDHDVADFKNLTGFSNIARDFLNKWITGDVNPEAVASLERILNNSAKNLDGKIKSLGSSFRNQFSVLPGREDELRSITGIDSLTTPTFGKGWKNNAFDESINVDERGRPLPRKQESAPQAAAPAQQQKPKLDQLPPKLIESYYRYALDPVTGVFNPARIEGLARTFGVSVDEVKRILTSRGRGQGGQ